MCVYFSFDFYKYRRETECFILPFAIIKITVAVALMRLVFFLTNLQRPVKLRRIILAATPSVLVVTIFILLHARGQSNIIFY